jgi:hypothetical protein
MTEHERPSDVVQESFRILLTESLCATSDDIILLLHDEKLDEFLDDIFAVAARLDLSLTAINLRKNYQRYLVQQMEKHGDYFSLPELTRLALSNSTVILSLLNGDQETVPLRRSIIRQPQRYRGCRLAHIPGLTREIMELVVKTDFSQITEDCELLAWFLGWGRDASLHTKDQHGREYTLRLDLGGWSNEPLMSPGIIPPGSWGNFPPGEVFCCPDPVSVNGSICINGSIPGFRIENGEEVILSFERGKLLHWESATGHTSITGFFDQHAASNNSDENWRMFCELGIGLNTCIRTLTGNPLFDEKAAQTVHIAIGDNTPFGHPIKAKMHCDMVTWFPTLVISGQEVISRGELRRSELRRFRRDWIPPSVPVDGIGLLKVRHAKSELAEGRLVRRLSSGDRVGTLEMSDIETSKALGALYERLCDYDGVHATHFISDFPDFCGIPTHQLLAYLHHYSCMIPPTDAQRNTLVSDNGADDENR